MWHTPKWVYELLFPPVSRRCTFPSFCTSQNLISFTCVIVAIWGNAKCGGYTSGCPVLPNSFSKSCPVSMPSYSEIFSLILSPFQSTFLIYLIIRFIFQNSLWIPDINLMPSKQVGNFVSCLFAVFPYDPCCTTLLVLQYLI